MADCSYKNPYVRQISKYFPAGAGEEKNKKKNSNFKGRQTILDLNSGSIPGLNFT